MRAHGAVVLLVLWAAAPSLADVETLVRRAETRLQHENAEGAVRLLEEALREDPACGPALVKLADVSTLCREDATELWLRYLSEARPLAIGPVRDALLELRQGIVDLTDELYLDAEREAMLPTEATVEACGPWRPWERPFACADPAPPSGPLRGEVFGTAAHRHRDTLRLIAARFQREGIADAVAWARLAALHRLVGDAEAARAALERGRPEALEDRVAVAESLMRSTDDPVGWWNANGPGLLTEVAALGRKPTRYGRPEMASLLCAAARDALSRAGDLRGLVALAAAESRFLAVGASDEVLASTATAIGRRWFLEDACRAIEGESDPVPDCIRAEMLFQMEQRDEAVALLERTVKKHPDCLVAWSRLAKFHMDAGGATAEDSARMHLVGHGPIASPVPEWSHPNPIERLIFLDRTLLTDDAAAATSRRILRACPTPEVVGSIISAWGGTEWGALTNIEFLRDGMPPDLAAEVLQTLPFARLPLSVFQAAGPSMAKEFRARVARCPPHCLDWLWVYTLSDRQCRLELEERKALLRAFADGESWTLGEEEYLLRVLESKQRGLDLCWVRARQDLEADAAFASSAAGPYILSLLCDPVFACEKVDALRHASFERGFRSPRLLLALADDGVDVSAGLGDVEPVVARLVRAVCAKRPEALEEFLEDDEASPTLLREARARLPFRYEAVAAVGVARRLLVDAGTPPGSAEVARDVWEALQERPSAFRDILRAVSVHLPRLVPPCARALCRDVRPDAEEILGRGIVRALGKDKAERLPRLPDALATDTFSSARLLREVLTLARPGELRALLDDPGSLHDLLVSSWELFPEPHATPLLDEVRVQARAHPRDLRWLELAARLGGLLSVDPLVVELAEKRLDSCRRDPKSIEESSWTDESGSRTYSVRTSSVDTLSIVRLIVKVVEDDPPRAILAAHFGYANGLCAEDRETAGRWLEGCCRDDADLDAVSRAADHWSVGDLSARIDPKLVASPDRETRTDALCRTWKRGRTHVAEELEAAREPGWTPAQARRLWNQVLVDALTKGEEAASTEALEALWTRCPGEKLFDGATLTVEGWNTLLHGIAAGRIRPADARLAAFLHFYYGEEHQEDFDRVAAEGDAAWDDSEWLYHSHRWLADRLVRGLPQLPVGGSGIKPLDQTLVRVKDHLRPEALGPALARWERGTAEELELCGVTRALLGYAHSYGIGACDCPLCTGAVRVRGVDPHLIAALVLPTAGERAACLAAAEARCPDRGLRELIGLARADHEGAEEAVRICFALLRGSDNQDVRRKAYDRLRARFPAHHRLFVDALLEEVPQADPSVARSWETRLASDNESERKEAQEELRGLGMRALPLLKALRASADPQVGARVEPLLIDLASP